MTTQPGSLTADTALVNRADRLANLGLFALALAAWLGVAVVLIGFDPRADAVVLLAGALLIGAAVGSVLLPLLWPFVARPAPGRAAWEVSFSLRESTGGAGQLGAARAIGRGPGTSHAAEVWAVGLCRAVRTRSTCRWRYSWRRWRCWSS